MLIVLYKPSLSVHTCFLLWLLSSNSEEAKTTTIITLAKHERLKIATPVL